MSARPIGEAAIAAVDQALRGRQQPSTSTTLSTVTGLSRRTVNEALRLLERDGLSVVVGTQPRKTAGRRELLWQARKKPAPRKGQGQIHLDVPFEFWDRVFAGTDQWADRSMANICRYALRELFVDREEGRTTFPKPPPRGPRRVAVWATGQDDLAEWDALAAVYGSRAGALAVALSSLLASFEFEG